MCKYLLGKKRGEKRVKANEMTFGHVTVRARGYGPRAAEQQNSRAAELDQYSLAARGIDATLRAATRRAVPTAGHTAT